MKKLGAVIIEDRKIGEFYKIVKEHMKYLPKDTDILIYTSESTEKEYKKLLKDDNGQMVYTNSNEKIRSSYN